MKNTPKTPRCFTPEQWKSYKRFIGKRGSHCRDCTPDYKNRMCKQGLCDHPDVTFKVAKGEGVVGVRNKSGGES